MNLKLVVRNQHGRHTLAETLLSYSHSIILLSILLNDMEKQTGTLRCITPTEFDSDLQSDDDEIPHLLKPNSSDYDEEVEQILEHEHAHHLQSGKGKHRYLLRGVPSSYVTNDGMMDSSPVSSISKGSRGSELRSSRGKRGHSSRKKHSRRVSSEQSYALSGISNHRVSTVMKVKPRAEHKLTSIESISPILGHGKSWTSHSSSSGSLKGRESPHSVSSRPPPSPSPPLYTKRPICNSAFHRRSTSLNLPSAYSTLRRKQEDSRLCTLKEGRIPSIPITSSPISIQRRTKNADGTHRRTVSFPDEVLQNQNIDRSISPNHSLYPYNDFTLESDDPALFSLVETTQVRSNGRVFIAMDVDTLLVSPGVVTSQSTAGGSSSVDSICLKEKCLKNRSNERGTKKHRREKCAVGDSLRVDMEEEGLRSRAKSFDGTKPSCSEGEGCDMSHFASAPQMVPDDEFCSKQPSPELTLNGEPFANFSPSFKRGERSRYHEDEEIIEFKQMNVDGSISTAMVSSDNGISAVDDSLDYKSRSKQTSFRRKKGDRSNDQSCVMQ